MSPTPKNGRCSNQTIINIVYLSYPSNVIDTETKKAQKCSVCFMLQILIGENVTLLKRSFPVFAYMLIEVLERYDVVYGGNESSRLDLRYLLKLFFC